MHLNAAHQALQLDCVCEEGGASSLAIRPLLVLKCARVPECRSGPAGSVCEKGGAVKPRCLTTAGPEVHTCMHLNAAKALQRVCVRRGGGEMLSTRPPLDLRCAVPLPPHFTHKSSPDSLGGASSRISTVFHSQTHPPFPSPPHTHTTTTPLHLTARLKLYCPRISSRSAGPGCFIHHPAAVLGGPSHTAQSSVGDSGVGAMLAVMPKERCPIECGGRRGRGSDGGDTHSTLNNGRGEAHGTFCVKEVQGPGGSGGNKVMMILNARAVNPSLVTIPSLIPPFHPSQSEDRTTVGCPGGMRRCDLIAPPPNLSTSFARSIATSCMAAPRSCSSAHWVRIIGAAECGQQLSG